VNAFTLDESFNSRVDLGLRITKPPVIPSARRVVTPIIVDGREGNLTLLRGWEDMTTTLRVALIGANIHRRWNQAVARILSAKSIFFSTDPQVYYQIKYAEVGALERRLTNMYEFSVTLVLAPFRFIRGVSDITLNSSGNITNPGTIYSLPLITVFGTGNRSLTINGNTIRLNLLQGNLTLDSELRICSFGNVAQDNQMIGDFPEFRVGSNNITLGTGISRVEISPRWRHV